MTEREIFINALKKGDSVERSAYLDQACGTDAVLRQRIQGLLQEYDQLGTYLESSEPAPAGTVDEPVGERPGMVIGPYKLLQQIGEGGMGTVYMAEQTHPVQRKVALKLIKAGMDSRQVIARFEAERQALALMDHPNIARVLDAGTTDTGRPYFVMELVKGVPITKYCDEHHLTPRERLELFVPVCQAVQHAHHKGIIHRDMKPSNVMVCIYDGKPVPKVIDFGVAKATGSKLTERTLYTEFGAIVGTFEYMSPEQAVLDQLDVDTRSDIYSLGVLLYELLTGTTPLERKRMKEVAILELLRLVREEEAPRPSTRLSTAEGLPSIAANRGTEPKKLSGLMRGELDWIVMKALEKDRNRRYDTANAFAADVLHYLHDESVLACPPSASHRIRKFARRNKVVLATVAGVAAALLVGTAAATWQAVRATRAEAAALAEADAKDKALAAESAQRKRAEAGEAETKAVLDFVENKVFAAARPRGREGGQGYDVKLADALMAALPFVDKSFRGRPLIEARLRRTLGLSFFHLGDAKNAIEQNEKARALYTEHRGLDHPDTLDSMMGLASSYYIAGRIEEAIKLHEETLRLQKARLGPDHQSTLRSRSNLASFYLAAGRTQDALKLQEETLQLQKAKLGPDHPDTLTGMNNLAEYYRLAGRTQEALKLHEESLQLKKAKLGPDHPDTLTSMYNLGNTYADVGRTQEGLKLREETVQLVKTRLGPDHPETLRSMAALASSFFDAGRTEEAFKLHEETIQLRKARLGPDHPDTLTGMNNLAEAYFRTGRTQEALKLTEETLRLRKAKLGPEHPDTLRTMNNLANSYIGVGESAKALAILQITLALRERRANVEPGNSAAGSYIAWTHGQRGEAEQDRLDYAAAALAYARSVEMFECLGQVGALDAFFRKKLSVYSQRLALCRKAEQAVRGLDFTLKQPAAEVSGLLDMRVRFLLKEQKLPAAVDTAAKMKELAGDKAEQLYNAACAYALCAGEPGCVSAANNPRVADAARLAKTCAVEAMALLKQAVARGYKNAAHMKQDKDLVSLHERQDFKKLLGELEAPKMKKPS